MISLLVSLLILAIIVYVVYLILGMLALPPQIKTIVYVITGIIVLLWLLQYFNIYSFPLR